MSVKERLIDFLKYKKLSQAAFSNIIGVSSGFVNAIRVSIQPDKIQSISVNFPELNIAWLLTGEGDMLKSDPSSVVSQINNGDNGYNSHVSGSGNIIVREPEVAYGSNEEVLKKENELLKEIIEEKERLIDEKERLINVLMKKQ